LTPKRKNILLAVVHSHFLTLKKSRRDFESVWQFADKVGI
jgi:hypothetical protein